MATHVTLPPRSVPANDAADILRSEGCKLRSVRSTYWLVAIGVVANVGFALLAGLVLPASIDASVDTVRISLAGIHLSQVAFGVLGVLVISSEYDTGLIRTTFAVVPRRRRVLAAKAVMVTGVTLSAGMGSCLLGFLAFQAVVNDGPFRASLGDAVVLRAVLGGGMYLALLGLLGLGLGTIVRRGVGAIAVVLVGLFVPQLLIEVLPDPWRSDLGRFLPMEAGSQIFSATHHGDSLGWWSGLAVMSVYTALALGTAAMLIERRDVA